MAAAEHRSPPRQASSYDLYLLAHALARPKEDIPAMLTRACRKVASGAEAELQDAATLLLLARDLAVR